MVATEMMLQMSRRLASVAPQLTSASMSATTKSVTASEASRRKAPESPSRESARKKAQKTSADPVSLCKMMIAIGRSMMAKTSR